MIEDNFKNATDSVIAPASNCFAVLPDDNTDIPSVTKALYVGTAGDLVIRPVRAMEDVRFANVPAGTILDIRVSAVRATGTTAMDIVGLA